MSLKSECEASVFSFAPLHKQLNANSLDEHKDYIGIVIHLHREEYERRKAAGETSFVLPAAAQEILNEARPW
ncbi:MAG: hypothetical protein ACYTBY_06370 [Planctomycetota bacterium]|jgi:hypothetical protein